MANPVRLIRGAGERLLFYLSQMGIQSDLRIDVVVPAAEKDLDVLPCAIDGIRHNIRHPVTGIFIVAPQSAAVQTLCRRKGCTFVDERSLVDMHPGDIGLVENGVDRSTWIYQQFLKWSASSLTDASHILVVDADTVFVRPQVFERDGKIIFNYSDEHHQAYFDMYERLLHEKVQFPLSFTSHQMLYDKSILAELKARIEQLHGCDWKEAVLRNLDRTVLSGASDYDTYGHYVFLHHPASMAIEYWFNLSLRRKKNLRPAGLLALQYGGKYKSLSFHSYKE